ncbi:MAG: winged helix-turn-helix transcriptional regulator [Nanoarchaeota archaeon]
MPLKLDIKDRKILYYLSRDGRLSDTQLSKMVALSKNGVAYRIERLKEEGVIERFSAIVNLQAVGYTTVAMILKFNQDIYKVPELTAYLRDHPFVAWASVISGQWDIFCEFVVKDVTGLYRMVQGLVQHYGERLADYEVYFSFDVIRVEHLVQDFYQDLDVEEILPKPPAEKPYHLDETDGKLLHALCKDSSLSYLDLSKRLGLSLVVTRYRIKKLQEHGVIVKFYPEIDLKKLGYTEYLYKIRLRNASSERMRSLFFSISKNPSIIYAFFDVVSAHLFLICAYKTIEGIDELSRALRNAYGSFIATQEFYPFKEHLPFILFPKGLVGARKDSGKREGSPPFSRSYVISVM